MACVAGERHERSQEVTMHVAAILSAKGATVEVIGPDTPVSVAVHRMASRGIGSLVVVGPGDELLGVLSERDIVRAIDRHGDGFSELRVREVVPSGVSATCSVADDLSEVMRRMTLTRQRHLPVLDGDKLVGIISIGDVVKYRLDELEMQTNVLRDAYLSRS
jgi:CBS domain-containing protein